MNQLPPYEINHFALLYLPHMLRVAPIMPLCRTLNYPLQQVYMALRDMAEARQAEIALGGQVMLLAKRLNDQYTAAYTQSWQKIVIEDGAAPGQFVVKVPVGLQLQGPALDEFLSIIREHTIAGNSFTIVDY